MPGQGLVDSLNGLISGGGFPVGNFPGQGNHFPGQGGHFPGQGGHFPGQGGHFPGQGGNYPGQGSCKYWCRSPENQYYCCDRGNNQGQGEICSQERNVWGGRHPPIVKKTLVRRAILKKYSFCRVGHKPCQCQILIRKFCMFPFLKALIHRS